MDSLVLSRCFPFPWDARTLLLVSQGLQAARAADFAISYFGALRRLILIHGRYSYLRTSLVAQYSFYKSFFFCTMQICFGFVSFFSGNTLFNSLCITAYNAILFVPIVTFVFDKDVNFATVLANPWLYLENVRGRFFNLRTILWWYVRGFWQGLLVFFLTIGVRGASYHAPGHGFAADWDTLGLIAFCGYLWIQAFTMMYTLRNITVPTLVAIWGMHVFSFLLLIFANSFMVFDSLQPYWAVYRTFADSSFWLSNIVMVAAAILPVYALQTFNITFYPTEIDKLRLRGARNVSAGPCHSRCYGPSDSPSLSASSIRNYDSLSLTRRYVSVPFSSSPSHASPFPAIAL